MDKAALEWVKKDLRYDIQAKSIERDHHQSIIDGKVKRLKEIEAELAEAEEPKLGHGDYGETEDGDRFIVIEQIGLFGSPKAFYANKNGQVHINECTISHIRSANIFDHLKAVAEPLEDGTFYLGSLEFAMFDDILHLGGYHRGYPVEIGMGYLPKLILNLQRLEYAAGRAKDGKEATQNAPDA